MVKLSLIFLLLSQTWAAFGGSNLLDYLQAGKVKYSTASCQSFIQSANHQTLVSDKLKKLTVRAKDSRFVDDYYFHYTNASILLQTLKSSNPDRVKAQQEILQDGGYKAIMEYQMTYSDALSNVAGVGFYIAANPFSSQSYGTYQVALKVDPNAVFFDFVKNSAAYTAIVAEVTQKTPSFAYCDNDLQFSLMMNENGIDIVHYNEESEWLVTFNEDIFTQSRITNVGTTASASTIMTKLVTNGDGAAIIEYISDLNLNKRYAKISLDSFLKMLPAGSGTGQNLITKLADALKDSWSENLRSIFARLVATRSGSEMTNSMLDLANSGLVPHSSYLTIALTGTSSDFLKWISSRVLSSPQTARNWKSSYRDNVIELLKQNLIDLDFVMANAPAEFDKTRFFREYSALGDKQKIAQVILYMLEKESSIFTALDSEAKYTVFNDFLKNTGPAYIPRFTALIDGLGYPSATSFNYIARRPSLLGVNGLHFMSSYLQFKKDPALLTDQAIAALNSTADVNPSLVIHLLQNKSIYGTQGAKYVLGYFDDMTIDEVDPLLNSQLPQLMGPNEAAVILNKLLHESDGRAVTLLPKFIQTFSISASSLAQAISNIGSGLALGTGLIALKVVRNDAAVWNSFSDIKNATGIRTILSLARSHAVLQQYLIDEATPLLLSQPDQLPDLAPHVMATLLSSTRLRPYFDAYSEPQKLAMARRVRRFNPNESKQFMASITYSQDMVRANLGSLMNATTSSELEDLLNNPSFVSALSASEFETLVTKITRFKDEINMRTLLRSGVLDFNRSMTLAFSLERQHGADNLDELLEHQLKFDDLDADQKSVLLSTFTRKFTSVSQLARDKFWPILFSYASSDKRDLLVPGFASMTGRQKRDYFTHYSVSPEMIRKGIALFKTQSLNYIVEVLTLDDAKTVAQVLKFIEDNYPLQEDYALYMIKSYRDDMSSAQAQSSHLKNYVCKKVKKWYAFDEILDNCKDKEEKKALKERRKLLCE